MPAEASGGALFCCVKGRLPLVGSGNLAESNIDPS